MELASETSKIARYSPTSTPLLDVVRPLSSRKRVRLSAGEYFFLSGAAILALIALPDFRSRTESLAASFGAGTAGWIVCLIIPGGALLLSLATHEAGHVLAAWASGFRLSLGEWRVLPAGKYLSGRRLLSCDVLKLGVVSLEPRKLDHLSRRLCFLILGGPLASLVVPVIAEFFVRASQTDIAFTVHIFTAISFLLAIAELLPDAGKSSSSDGSRILMLLKNDAAAQRWLSILQLQLSLERGEGPLTWDEATVARATAVDDESRDAVAARWFGYLWATERQNITGATKYLEEALAAPAPASAWIRDHLFLEAAIFQAWFRDDLRRAHVWVDKIRSRKLVPAQQERLNVALLWAEGRLFEAWERLGEYLTLLRKLPESPARTLAEKSAVEWRKQMESRMLTRAWRSMYSISREVDQLPVPTPDSNAPVS